MLSASVVLSASEETAMVAIFLKSSSVERTIVVVKILVNSWGVETDDAVVHGCVSV